MPAPRQIDDGNFSSLMDNGPGLLSLPFERQGDTRSFEYRKKVRIQASSYVAIQNSKQGDVERPYQFATPRGAAYLISQGEPNDCGGGIIETTWTLAAYFTRYEGGSISYPAQLLSVGANTDWTVPPPTPEVAELALPLNCRIKYEYFITPAQVTAAPKVYVVFGRIYKLGGWGALQAGKEYAAQDSEISVYNGFQQKKTILITWPAGL